MSDKKIRILLLGDKCTDVWIDGTCDRISPEAPVPVFKPSGERNNGGMASNVKSNITSLYPKADVIFISNKEVIEKIRYVDKKSGYHLIRVDKEREITPLSFLDVKHLLDDIDGIIISDYNKGFITQDLIQKISEYAKSKNTPVFLDTKKKLGEWSKKVTFVKINESEYRLNANLESFCENLIITLGPDGSLWFNKGLVVPVEKINIKDVAGAGDTYLAAFAIAYILYKDVKIAMEKAGLASTIAVSSHGVVCVSGKGIFYE